MRSRFIDFKIKKVTVRDTNTANSLLQPATLLKLTLLHGCFSSFLNCASGIKSRNASHILSSLQIKKPKNKCRVAE